MPCIWRAATATRLDDMADLVLEFGGEPAHRLIAFQFGPLCGFAAFGIGAGFGGAGGFGFRRLLRRGHEQARQSMCQPDQNGGFDDQNAGVKHNTPKIGPAREDRRGKQMKLSAR